MSEGGNSLDESIGLITAANEVVNDPSSVGTALKTLTLRLRGSKTELEEMGEDVSDMATTTSQLQAKLLALTGGQVDIMADANTFKNSTQILREMAEAWEDMTDIQRASALELMGGKRQANVLSALIQNFDTVEKAIETSANSAGSALKENERYLDSIQGKIDQFNNAMQSMWSNFLNADAVKFVVQVGTALIKAADTLGWFGSLVSILAGSKLVPWILTSITGMNTFGESLQYVGMMMTSVSGTGASLISTIITQTAALWAGSAGANVFTLSLQTLRIAFTALMATPLGWLLAAMAAIVAIVGVIDLCYKSTKELTEELNELKSELADVRSELNSVNQELKTTNDRMAELLAKDKLTFEEQEELDRLRATNDELERRKELLEDEEEYKSERVGRQAAKVVDRAKNDRVHSKAAWDLKWENDKNKHVISDRIASYKSIKFQMGYAKSLKDRDKYQKQLDKEAKKIDEYINTISEALDGVEYGDSEESDAALDYLAEIESKYAIARGSEKAKSGAVTGVLAKEEFAETKAAIDEYVDALEKGDKSAAKFIEQIINNNTDLVEDLKARGVEAKDAIDYYTMLGSEANYATIDGKIEEVSRAAKIFDKILMSDELVHLFNEEGKIIQTQLSQVFYNTSAKTREDITSLLEGSYEQIKNGTVDTERLLTGFALKTTQQVLAIQTKVLGDQNLELFPNLKDEINGIIDTFNEFSTAVGSVVDALDTLDKARAEEAYSGSMSIETLENLMKYTDDYTELVEIDEVGAIKLKTNAEEILIEKQLEKIKADAAAAVQTAQTNLAQAEYNAKAVNETGPIQEALTAATDGLAGAWAYLGSIIGDIKGGNFSGILGRASKAYNDATTGREEKRAQVNVSVEDAKEALDKALDQQKIANALTPDNAKKKYSSEEASGGNATKEDAEKSKLDEKMEEFQREMDYWENRIAANQAKYEQIQNEIDLLETKGQKADKAYYEEQAKLEGQRLELLNGQKAAAQAYLATLTEGSEEWWEVASQLNDIEGEIDDVTASIVDLQDAIGEIDTYKFEEFNKRLDDITRKLGTIRDFIAPNGEEDWFDDEGNWTEEGVAVLGTYIQELETYKAGLGEAEDAYADYVKEYAGNEKYYAELGIHSEQELYDKREELIEQQYDYAQSISDTEQSIVDMYESRIDAIEEYIETLIDSYNDYIDSVKEALDAERDLYDFKRKIEDQSKSVAETERKIAALSGSTNAADVAERRRLQATLYDQQRDLEDSYRDHSRQSQQDALDSEAEAYEESMNKFVEGLRTSLEEATSNMDEFLMGVTSMVMYNADTVLNKYEETNLPLTKELTNPWEQAKKAVGSYSGDALALMNKWTEKGGFFEQFNATGTTNLKSPWGAGTTAANTFKTSVSDVMSNVVSNISTNVKTASAELAKLYQQIKDTEARAASAKVDVEEDEPGKQESQPFSTTTPTPPPNVTKKEITVDRISTPTRPTFKKVGDLWSGVGHTGVSIGKKTYNKALEIEGGDGIYYPFTNGNGYKGYIKKGEGYTVLGNGKMDIHSMKPLYQKYAKGTTGTTRDQFAITDEPQFGDELTMYATPEGTLSFMRAGSTVIPADLTRELIDLPNVVDGLINRPKFDSGINMIANAINKPEIVIDVENFLKVDRVDKDSLPQLEAMMDKKIDTFAKQLNYSIKKFAR